MELQLIRKGTAQAASTNIVTAAQAVTYLLRYVYDRSQLWREKFVMLLLDNAGQVLGWFTLSEGGTANCSVDVRTAVCVALKGGAGSVILAHNHPSGNPLPSQRDIQTTHALKKAFGVFDIKMLDHVVLGDGTFYSFCEEMTQDMPEQEYEGPAKMTDELLGAAASQIAALYGRQDENVLAQALKDAAEAWVGKE